MKQRNLAVQLLQKLLKGEPVVRRRKNVVQARSFAKMLEQTGRRYGNRAVEAAQVIEELIQLARDMREANARGETLGLTEDELAFCYALETNDSAVQVLGDETLRDIARSWSKPCGATSGSTGRFVQNVRANLRRLVKRILLKHGYPPDKQEKATQMVLGQAEALSTDWWRHSPARCYGPRRSSVARCERVGVCPRWAPVGNAYDSAMCESFFATLESSSSRVVECAGPQAFRRQGGDDESGIGAFVQELGLADDASLRGPTVASPVAEILEHPRRCPGGVELGFGLSHRFGAL